MPSPRGAAPVRAPEVLDRPVKGGEECADARSDQPVTARRRSHPPPGQDHSAMADPLKPRPAFAPWDRREIPGLFDVEESARRVGIYKWIEMRLFEALGGWVATVPELDVKLVLGRHCYHHAWHAELWHKRLPELREMRPERLIRAPNTDLEAFVAALTVLEAAGLTTE